MQLQFQELVLFLEKIFTPIYGEKSSLLPSKVLKRRPNRIVRLEKSRTTHFCSSFSIKNRFIGKKQRPVRTAVGPHSSENRDQTAFHGSLLPFESEP